MPLLIAARVPNLRGHWVNNFETGWGILYYISSILACSGWFSGRDEAEEEAATAAAAVAAVTEPALETDPQCEKNDIWVAAGGMAAAFE